MFGITDALPPVCTALVMHQFFYGDYLDDLVGGARHGVHDDACDSLLLLVRDRRAEWRRRVHEGHQAVVAGEGFDARVNMTTGAYYGGP